MPICPNKELYYKQTTYLSHFLQFKFFFILLTSLPVRAYDFLIIFSCDENKEENAAATARYKDLLETMNSGSNTETDDVVNMSMSRDKIEDLLNFAGNSISEWQDANADLSVECCARQDAFDELTKQVERFDEWLSQYKRVCHASSLAFKAVKSFGDLFDAVAEIANIDDFDEIVKGVNAFLSEEK